MPTFDEFRKSVETGGINFNKPEVVSKNVENNDWWSKFIKDKQQYQLTNNTFAVKSILNDMSVLPAITKLAEDIEKYITKLVKPDNKDQQDKIKNSIKTLDKVSKTTKTTFQKFSDTTARYLERAGELIEETVKFMDSSFTFSRKVKLGGSKLLTALGNALAPGAVYSGLANTYSGISKHIEKFITGTMRTLFSTFSNSESTNKIISGFEWVISKTFTVFSWIAKTGFYLLDRAWALIKGLAKIGWGVIKGVFSTIYDLTLSIGDFFVDLMIEIFSNPILLVSAMAAIYLFSGDVIKPMMKKAANFIGIVWDEVSVTVVDKFKKSGQGILEFLGFDKAQQDEFVAGMNNFIKTVFNMKNMNEWWNSSFGLVFGLPKDSFVNMVNGITSFAGNVWDDITTVFKRLVSVNFMERISEMWSIVKTFVTALKPDSSPQQEALRNVTGTMFDATLATQLQPYASTYITRDLIKHIYDVYGSSTYKNVKDIKPKLTSFANTSLAGFISNISGSPEFKQKIQKTIMNDIGLSIDSLVESVLTTDDITKMKTNNNIEFLDTQSKVENDLGYIFKQLNDYSSGKNAEDASARLDKFLNSSTTEQKLRINNDFKEQTSRLHNLASSTQGTYKDIYDGMAVTVEMTLKNTELGLLNNEQVIADFNDLFSSFKGGNVSVKTFDEFLKKLKASGVSVSPLVYSSLNKMGTDIGYKPEDITILLQNNVNAVSQDNQTPLVAPKLATGGVVKDATLTWVGEGKSEEMVIPINKEGIQFIYNVTKNIEANEKKKKVTKVRNYYENYGPTEPDETLYDLRNMATGFVEAM